MSLRPGHGRIAGLRCGWDFHLLAFSSLGDSSGGVRRKSRCEFLWASTGCRIGSRRMSQSQCWRCCWSARQSGHAGHVAEHQGLAEADPSSAIVDRKEDRPATGGAVFLQILARKRDAVVRPWWLIPSEERAHRSSSVISRRSVGRSTALRTRWIWVLPAGSGRGSIMDCVFGIALSASSKAKYGIRSGGLVREIGILGTGRPVGPLTEAVPIPSQLVLGLPPQPGYGTLALAHDALLAGSPSHLRPACRCSRRGTRPATCPTPSPPTGSPHFAARGRRDGCSPARWR